jgi:hypothetical protein
MPRYRRLNVMPLSLCITQLIAVSGPPQNLIIAINEGLLNPRKRTYSLLTIFSQLLVDLTFTLQWGLYD